MAEAAPPAEAAPLALVGPRLATAADKDEVLGELSRGVYGDDNDYLCCVFDQWLADDIHAMHVLEDDIGRIVGLDTISQYDQGRTIMFQALRVLPSCKGQGVGKRLSSSITQIAKAKHAATADRIRMTTLSPTNAASLAIFRKNNYAFIAEKALMCYEPVHGTVDPAQKALLDLPALTQVDAAGLWALLQAHGDLATLVEANAIVFDWEAHELSLANLEYLAARGALFHAGVDGDGRLESFALSYAIPKKVGELAGASIYTGSAAYTLAHMALAMEAASAEQKKIFVFVDRNVDTAEVARGIARLAPSAASDEFFEGKTLVLVEKPLADA